MLANIGPTELLVLIMVLLAFFGKKKTSEIARDAGEASREFKKIEQDYRNAIEELKNPQATVVPIMEPIEEPKVEKVAEVEELKTAAAPIDAAKAEVAQLAQLAQKAKEKSSSKGGGKSA